MTSTTFFLSFLLYPVLLFVHIIAIDTNLVIFQTEVPSLSPWTSKINQRDKNYLDKRKGCIRLWFSATLSEGQDCRLSLSLSDFHLSSTAYCISWGQSGSAKLVCEFLNKTTHLSESKVKNKRMGYWPICWQEKTNFNSSITSMWKCSIGTSLAEHFVVYLQRAKEKENRT